MARSELKKHKIGDTIKWIITFIVGLALIGGMVTLFVKLDRQSTSLTTVKADAYSIGMLDENGNYAEGETAIYTRKAVTVDELSVDIIEDATVTYKLYFYDNDGKFLSATGALDKDYDGDIPAAAKSVKIVITPTEDKDGKVSLSEISDYAKQVTVTVKK